jgi:hypothetical protein
MADETHKLQKDPPEGSRKVVERELERQSDGAKEKAGSREKGGSGATSKGDKPGRGGRS